MPKNSEAEPVAPPSRTRGRDKWWKRREFLLISIAVHLLFGLGAGYLVVSHYTAARKLTFQAGPKSPNRSERAIQHKVQLQEKMKTAPPIIPKRILTAGIAKITLPPLPDVSGLKSATPGPLMAAAGQNAKFGAQAAMIGSAAGTNAGAAINFFGIRDKSSSVVIMIDVSDSMFTRTGDADGRKLVKKGKEQNFQTIRDEAIRLVESLGDNIQFGIVRWAGSARSWKSELIPATEENKRAAIDHIENEVNMKTARPTKGEAGGTRHDLALRSAFDLKPEVIYMLTDGNATIAEHKGGMKPIAPETLLHVAAEGQKGLRRSARVHVIYYVTGEDRDEERQMLMSLASRNGGQFRGVSATGRKE
ncbi:MAG: vWA domain-containing protein [Chthoniobacterales bacterium]